MKLPFAPLYHSIAGVMLMACAGLPLQASDADANLIRNGNFEFLDPDGLPDSWVAGANPTAFSLLGTAESFSGNRAVRMTPDGSRTTLSQLHYMDLEPGKVYTFSAYVRLGPVEVDEGYELSDSLKIQVINLGWSFGYQSALKVEHGTHEWTRVTRTFTVPAADRFPYNGKPNTQYKVMIMADHLHGQVDIDAIQLEEGRQAGEVVLPKHSEEDSVDPVTYDDVRKGFSRADYPVVKEPLYETLLEDEPLNAPSWYYGWSDVIYDVVMRPYAKKFAHRYVQAEEVEEITNHGNPYIAITSGQGRGGAGSYPTLRQIFRPDAEGIAPKVFDAKGGAWTLDPRFLAAEREAALNLARTSRDPSPTNRLGNTYGLMMGDERFESRAIKLPPKELWYPEIEAADKEVREKFGYGKYGLPESPEDDNPFRRIAHRRWANDQLLKFYTSLTRDLREINPDLKLVAPILSGGVPPLDIEAIAPLFDYFSNQSWNGVQPYVQQYASAADTKALVDLAGIPVIALLQHTAMAHPAAIREQHSQAYRNGAVGTVLLSTEWWDRELEHVKLIDPGKWHTLRAYAEAGRTQRKLRFPEADTALLYSSTTYLSFSNPKMALRTHPEVYSNYIALGPDAGSWFRFVSDRMIERGTADLSKYKLLYLPLATYQSREVLTAVEDYLKGGGTIVAADPEAFSWAPDGTALSSDWSSITGVRLGEVRPGQRTATVKASGKELIFPKPGRAMELLDENAEVAARFPDGSPAMVIRKVGKGAVISFAENPFAGTSRNDSVGALVKHLQTEYNARTGQEIWRFLLPEAPPAPVVADKGEKCLTGNLVRLGEGGPRSVKNEGGRGRYRWSAAVNEGHANEWISFREGKLTNRIEAYETRQRGRGRGPAEVERWTVRFPGGRPVPELEIDLTGDEALGYLGFYYSGELPAITISTSSDGEKWQEAGVIPAAPFTPDVLEAGTRLDRTARYVKIAFGSKQETLELAELEIWSR